MRRYVGRASVRPRSAVVLVAALTSVVGTTLAATSQASGPSVVRLWTDDFIQGHRQSPVPVGESFIQSAGSVCLDGPSSEARVTAVELLDAIDLELTTFSVIQAYAWPGGMLADTLMGGYDPGSGTSLKAVCDSGKYDSVNVQVVRVTGEVPSSLRGYRVHWTTGKRDGSFDVPMELVLCDHDACSDVIV